MKTQLKCEVSLEKMRMSVSSDLMETLIWPLWCLISVLRASCFFHYVNSVAPLIISKHKHTSMHTLSTHMGLTLSISHISLLAQSITKADKWLEDPLRVT